MAAAIAAGASVQRRVAEPAGPAAPPGPPRSAGRAAAAGSSGRRTPGVAAIFGMPVCWCGGGVGRPRDQRRRRARRSLHDGRADLPRRHRIGGIRHDVRLRLRGFAHASLARKPGRRVPGRALGGVARANGGGLGGELALLFGRERLVRGPARTPVRRRNLLGLLEAQARLAALGRRQPGPVGHACLRRARARLPAAGGMRSASCTHFCLRIASMPDHSCCSGSSASRCAGLSFCQRTPSSTAPRRGVPGCRPAPRRAAPLGLRRLAGEHDGADRCGQRQRARRRRPAGSRRGPGLRATLHGGAASLARRGLQEFDEAGVAVGAGRKIVGQQRRIDLGGHRDLGAGLPLLDQHQAEDQHASGSDRGELDPPAGAAARAARRRRRWVPRSRPRRRRAGQRAPARAPARGRSAGAVPISPSSRSVSSFRRATTSRGEAGFGEFAGGGGRRRWLELVHGVIPFALRAFASACTAREQCVLTLPSEQPIEAAVSATSSSSQ